MNKPVYADIASADEDTRIQAIVAVAKTGKKVGVATDDEPGKAERYIEKIKALLPGVVITQGKGLVAGTVTLKVELPVSGN